MIDIVIVNWNSGDLLSRCIDAIFTKANEDLLVGVYIIDNNSTDTSLQALPAHHKLHIIQNTVNAGFSKACNQGFRLSTAPFVLLLNPDTVLMETTLADCISCMQAQKEIDILGCQLLNDEGEITPTCARFPKPIRYVYHALGLSTFAPKRFHPPTLMTDWNHKESRMVDQVMGAFMFIRREIFEKIGYFDERFFVYYEELDYSLRLKIAGGKSFYNSQIQAIHSGMGTTEKVKAFRLFLSLRSRLQYAKKHFSLGGYIIVIVFSCVVEFITRQVMLLTKGKFSECMNVFKAYGMLLQKRKLY